MYKKLTSIVALVLCFTLTFGVPVFAEVNTPLKISKMGISVMPEYDTSEVLVLYALTFQNQSNQPYSGDIRFPVPKGTTSNIVTENANGSDTHVNLRAEDKGDSAEFVWKPLQPIQPNAVYSVHLEYYYNPLPGTGGKSFTYSFPANMPVDQPQVHVYQPLKATDFKMEPAGQPLGNDQQGFQVYGFSSPRLKPGDKIEFKVSYTKNDPSPSVQPPSAAAGTPGGTAQTAPASKGQLSSAAILVPLAALVIGVAFIAVKALGNSRPEEKQSASGSAHRNRESQKPVDCKLAQEKKRLRQLLINGNIGEETYYELLSDLESEHS